MRYLFILLCCIAFAHVAAPHAAFAANYYNADAAPAAEEPAADEADNAADMNAVSAIEKPQPSHNFVVTSVNKCYAKLDRKDALEIQRGYVKPYEECQRRLAAKTKRDQSVKAGDAPKGTAKAGAKADAKAEDNSDAAKASLTADSIPHGFYRIGKSQLPIVPEQPNNADKRDKTPTGNR